MIMEVMVRLQYCRFRSLLLPVPARVPEQVDIL